MRQNYKGNKMRREALQKQKQEAKRLKRLNKKQDDHSEPVDPTEPTELPPTGEVTELGL